MADLQQLQQQDPVLGPVLAAWTAKLSDTKERSTRVLVQQRRFLKNGILRRGQADQRRGTREQLILPISLSPMSKRGHAGTTSAAARDALWCHALGKRKGI